MTTAFPFHQESYLTIISPCMNTGIHVWIICSDELQNLWTARTGIVNCWHVNPPDSCWLCSEAQAIWECGNLKKTFWIRRGPHTHASLWHTGGKLTAHRILFWECNRTVFFYNADLFYRFSKLRFSPVASWAVALFFLAGHPTQISRSQSLSAGSFLFFPFSTRAFPLPCRPRPWFSPVTLMLKRSLRQSITAKTTKSWLPAG